MRGGVAVGVWGEGLVVREGVGVGVGPGVALKDRSAFSRSLVSFLASVTEKTDGTRYSGKHIEEAVSHFDSKCKFPVTKFCFCRLVHNLQRENSSKGLVNCENRWRVLLSNVCS